MHRVIPEACMQMLQQVVVYASALLQFALCKINSAAQTGLLKMCFEDGKSSRDLEGLLWSILLWYVLDPKKPKNPKNPILQSNDKARLTTTVCLQRTVHDCTCQKRKTQHALPCRILLSTFGERTARMSLTAAQADHETKEEDHITRGITAC